MENARSLRDYLYVVFKRKRLISFLTITIVIVSMAVTFIMPTIYEASARIVVEKKTNTSSPLLQSLSEDLSSETEIIRSRFLIEKVIGSSHEDLIKDIQSNLSIEQVDKSNVLKITYKNSNPSRSAGFLKDLTESYVDYRNTDKQKNATDDAFSYLEKKIASTRKKVELTDKKLQDFAKDQGIASFSEEISANINRVSELRSKLTDSQSSETAAAQKIKTLKKELIATPDKIKYETVSGKASTPNSTYQSIKAQISEAKATLSAERARQIFLKSEIATASESLNKLESNNPKFNNLVNALEDSQRSYRLYQDQFDQAQMSSKLSGLSSARPSISEQPSVPKIPTSPNLPLNAVLGVILGFTLSLGAAFTVEYFDHTFSRPEDIKAYLDLPLLMFVPDINLDDKQEDSMVQNQFNRLACQVMPMLKDKATASILVTSALRHEGVTTVATDLAISLATYGGLKTLIVDTNIDNPQVDTILKVSSSADSDGCLPTEIKNLMVMSYRPGNNMGDNTRTFFDDLLCKLDKRFDFVIFDSSPVLENKQTLLPHLAPRVDGVVLVTRARHTRWEVALKAKQEMINLDANIIGAVLNRRTFDIPKTFYQYL